MKANVAEIMSMMDTIAPSDLAESWDNVGLQVGLPEWSVQKIWVALDPTPQVMDAACNAGVDLLITHHPLIFKPLKSIDLNTAIGRVLNRAIQSRTAIFSAHTNLDAAAGGVNDVLAERIGLKNTTVLMASVMTEKLKLVVYVPEAYERKILQAMMACGVGVVENYTECTFRSHGRGTFKPGAKAAPFSGNGGVINDEAEIRIETIVEKININATLHRLRSVHPYETMAYDLYPLVTMGGDHGLGRVGELEKELCLKDFAGTIRKNLGIADVKVAGNPNLPVFKAAVCSGSGSGLLHRFFSSGAQVYISGDIGYHDARDIECANLGLVDIGHFASEQLVVAPVVQRLQEMAIRRKMDVSIESCVIEKDPFWHINKIVIEK